MATATSTGSGRWSAAIWSGGSGAGGAPADGDSVIISAGHSVLMDTDLSAWTGVVTLTVTGGVTPGMLYWCDQTAGLGIGTTKPNVATTQFGYLIGTTFYEKAAVAAGTALSGDDVPQGKYGAWALDIGTDGTIDITAATANGTGYDSAVLAVAGLPAVAASHSRVGYVTASKSDAVFDPGTTNLDAANTTVAYTSLTGTTAGFNRGYLKIRTAGSLVGTTSTNRGRLLANSNGTWGGTTAMAYANKAVIDMNGTALITATNLDIAMYGTNPSATSVRTYGQVFAECTVSAAADTLTYTGIAAALPNATLVRVTAGSGALPAELSAGTDYWVVSASGNTIKLATTSGGSAIDLSAGGPINVHSGFYGNWGVSGNTLTKTTHGLANGTAVMVKSTGTLPTPLLANEMYYVVSTASGSISLAYTSGGSTITLGGSPSGTLDVYTGSTGAAPGTGGTNPYTSTIANVLDDVTADTGWSTATGQNRVVLADEGPADYDQQRLTVSTITATTMTLSAAVDSIQYPNARIWLSSRNVSIRSAGTSSSQAIVDYSSATTLSGVFQCEIVNTGGSGTTFYGYGINNGTGHTISGAISGCNTGVNSGTSHTISGTISGGPYGVYSGISHTISGTISGCTYGVSSGTSHTISGAISGCSNGVNSGTSNTISGTIRGCSYGFSSGTSHTISGAISGCIYGFSSGTSHTISGTISGCTYGIGRDGGGAHIVSGTITGCDYHFRIDVGLGPTIIKHSSTTSTLVFYGRNTSYVPARISVEDSGGTLNAQKIHDMFGDILKTACNGTGNAPSVDPDAGNGNCIEVSNVQSNIATLGMKIFEHRVWATASTSKTYTYKMQTRYSGLGTADRIRLVASYLSAGSGVTRSTVTTNVGPATRTNAADWSKTMAVTVNPSQTGWVIITLTLYYYESGNEIYIWPNPAIT